MLRRLVLTASMMLMSVPALAQHNYSDVFFFGTSEFDTGNWLLNPTLSGNQFAPTAAKGYYDGRWLSGPNLADYIAQALGHDATPSLAGGQNYAYGMGWLGPLPGEPARAPGSLGANTALYFGSQVNTAIADYNGALPSNALYVVSVGSNDADLFGRTMSDADAVANLAVSHIQSLASAGARSFLVHTLGGPPANSFAAVYNQTLLGGLAGILGIQLTIVDTRTFNQTVVLAPGFLAGIGINDGGSCNLDPACLAAATAMTTNGEAYYDSPYYLFDNVHRDTKIVRAFAEYAVAQLPQTTVPEPSSIAMMTIGLLGAGIVYRKRRTR